MNLDLSHIDPDVLATCSEVDKIEYAMCKSDDKIDLPLTHVFTPGLYTRTIFMPAGSLVMSVTHNTKHPFVISSGEVDVLTPDGPITYIAPYMGITNPGTKRFLHVKRDTTWTTFHPNPENITDPDEIVKTVSEKLHNPLLDDEDIAPAWSKNVSSSVTINAIDDMIKIEEHPLNLESGVMP